jgi:hypothetical protein
VFDPNTAGTVYALQSCRLFRSRDGGATWAVVENAHPPGLLYGVSGYDGLAIAPGRPGRLYASG